MSKYADDFERGPNADINVGAPFNYTTFSGSGEITDILEGLLHNSASVGTETDIRADVDTLSPDMATEGRIGDLNYGSAADINFGLYIRYSGSADTAMYAIVDGTGPTVSTVFIGKRIAGVATDLASVPVSSIAIYDNWYFEAIGTKYRVAQNGVFLLSLTDGSITTGVRGGLEMGSASGTGASVGFSSWAFYDLHSIGAPQNSLPRRHPLALRGRHTRGARRLTQSYVEPVSVGTTYTKTGTATSDLDASGPKVVTYVKAGSGASDLDGSGPKALTYVDSGTGTSDLDASGPKVVTYPKTGTGSSDLDASGPKALTYVDTGAGSSDLDGSGAKAVTYIKSGTGTSDLDGSGSKSDTDADTGTGSTQLVGSGSKQVTYIKAAAGTSDLDGSGVNGTVPHAPSTGFRPYRTFVATEVKDDHALALALLLLDA